MITFDKEPAYVLHRRPYQEMSQLVQFLTSEHGRVTAVVRQSSKMLGKNVQAFIPVLISCRGRDDLLSLHRFDPQTKAILVKPEDQMVGMYINELVTRLVPQHMVSRQLFQYYSAALSKLAQIDDYEPILRQFELKLLEITGHGLQLDHDYMTYEPIVCDTMYRYMPGEGPVRCTQMKNGEASYCGKTLLDLRNESVDMDTQTLREAKELLRAVISYHLKNRTIHTRSIFRYLKEITQDD